MGYIERMFMGVADRLLDIKKLSQKKMVQFKPIDFLRKDTGASFAWMYSIWRFIGDQFFPHNYVITIKLNATGKWKLMAFLGIKKVYRGILSCNIC